MKTQQAILRTEKISKTFPGIKALDEVSIEIEYGDIHAIVGENGAGKSTLMSILGGVYRQDSGKIFLDGEEMSFNSPLVARNNGISLVHQELSLFSNLSVAENIFPNLQPLYKFRLIDMKSLYLETKKMLSIFNISDINPAKYVKNLSIAQQQVVEILKAIAFKPKVLILDEPTSSLTDHEITYLFKNIRALNENGITIIYISHHLKEIFEVCNKVSVLKDGKFVCTENVLGIDEDFLISKMTGKNIIDMFGKTDISAKKEQIMFTADAISKKGVYKNISFSVRKGEVLGFYGLVGSGRTEMALGIFGSQMIDSGKLKLDGKNINIRRPIDAIRKGIGYLTEDRKLLGLYRSMNIADNYISNHLNDFCAFGLMQNKIIKQGTEEAITRFQISTPSLQQRVNNLSGGNQQKLLIATWFGIRPKLIIIDEPTKGVDVGARSEIYGFIRKLAQQEIGIILISSDVLEIIGICDRIIILKDGEIVGELDNKKANEDNLIAIASGLKRQQKRDANEITKEIT